MIKIKKKGNSIPHKITGKFGAGLVVMLPGKDGTGIIAGGAMRSVFEALGIKDILAKSIRSKNSGSIVRATINGLMQLTLYSDKKKLLVSTIVHYRKMLHSYLFLQSISLSAIRIFFIIALGS